MSQKEFYSKITSLHEAITNKYRFNIVKGYATESVMKDVDFVRSMQNKLIITDVEKGKLNSLFSKYGIS